MVELGETHYMSKDKLHIIDTIFSHAHSSSWYNKPSLFDWVRSHSDDQIVITDNSLFMVDKITSTKKYAWLVESPKITPMAYEFIRNNYNKFDLIFTFDKDLLELSDKFVLLPIGGCWIEEEDRKLYEKTKLVSIILSEKKSTEGHQLRHKIVEKHPTLDVFGYNNHIVKKISGLKDYKFSVIIENCKKDYYFTEKLIDSFMAGTIPIYWGCPSIGNFFDISGMLIFDTLDELDSIMNNLNKELYDSKIESIKYNFEEAKKYLVADNIIYNKIKENESN